MQPIRQTLAAGKPLWGINVSYPSTGAVERIGKDWDWLWIDGQHGQVVGFQELLAMVRTCDAIDRYSFLRVPWNETSPIALALDMGATGVIVPCVSTVEEARRAVEAAKFPPLGNRSYGGRRVIDLHGRAYAHTANDDTLLIIQIETPLAVENVDRLAAIDGVDGLMFGPDDILLRRGHRMDAPRPRALLEPDMRAVGAACRRHGKVGVIAGVVDEAMYALSIECGFQMLVAGIDVLFLAEGSRRCATQARAWAGAR